MLLPALSAAKNRALRTSCASNEHELGIALLILADDNNNKLPTCDINRTAPLPGTLNPPNTSVYGFWPWDISAEFTTNMIQNGAARNVFYDPANAAANVDTYWNFGVAGAPASVPRLQSQAEHIASPVMSGSCPAPARTPAGDRNSRIGRRMCWERRPLLTMWRTKVPLPSVPCAWT